MNNDTIQDLKDNVDCALSNLHTLIIAYGFNTKPMCQNAKALLPLYSNQIADILCVVNEHLISAQDILREEMITHVSSSQYATKTWDIPKDAENNYH